MLEKIQTLDQFSRLALPHSQRREAASLLPQMHPYISFIKPFITGYASTNSLFLVLNSVCACVRACVRSLSHRPPEGRHYFWDPRTKDLSGVCPFFAFCESSFLCHVALFLFFHKQLLSSLDSSPFRLFLFAFGCLVKTTLSNMPCVHLCGLALIT